MHHLRLIPLHGLRAGARGACNFCCGCPRS
jgi:hypothetical protein